ncbi:MAG: oxidoreductase [Bacillota bacterium]
MNEKIRVGIIGFGLSGRVFHAPIIHSLDAFQIKKIVTTKKESIDMAQKSYPWAEFVSDANQVFEDPEIDLIVVSTPNTSHVKLASEGLRSKKHVVVEKPFTVTSKEADELIALAKREEKILTVYQNRRWDSDFQTVKKVIENRMLGNVVEYEAHFDRFRNYLKPNAWREENLPGSGILYDLGSHLIDQAQCLFGLPKEITADIRKQRENSLADDCFEIILHYEKLKVTLKAGMLVREPLPRFIIHGDQGSFVKYGIDVQEEALKNGLSPLHTSDWGQEPEEIWGILNTDWNGLHVRGKIESMKGDYSIFYQNVYRAILNKEELYVKPEEARNTIRIIELANESSELKKTVPFVLA